MGGPKRNLWLIALATAGALAICGAAALMPGSYLEKIGLATRLTARWSFCWFLAAFAARPLYRMFGGVWSAVLRQRRYVGLGFAAAHTIHGICFSIELATTSVTRSPLVYIGGGTAYLFMFAMAATSSDAAMRALGKNWRRLHLTGMWTIWFVFLFSYGGRIFRPDTQWLGATMTALLVLAALIRIPGIQRLPRRRATGTQPA